MRAAVHPCVATIATFWIKLGLEKKMKGIKVYLSSHFLIFVFLESVEKRGEERLEESLEE